MEINKKSKYYKDGYLNPLRCSETVVKIATQDKWILEMSEGIKDAQTEKANNIYNPSKFNK